MPIVWFILYNLPNVMLAHGMDWHGILFLSPLLKNT